jgi:hypothetical protein
MIKNILIDTVRKYFAINLDPGLFMAIIAINMTVIGFTSLADTKCVIGIDYGKFLIKKFKLFGIRMYYWLIAFALINIISLFTMAATNEYIRNLDFILLIFSLIFAIYYFFGFILVENIWVQEQVFKSELLGLYFSDDDKEHLKVDQVVKMNPGNRTSNKLSTNVINYFGAYNGESQQAFMKAFGPDSILYSENKKIAKYRQNHFQIKKYEYRTSLLNKNVKDISFEFFQLFRYCDLQDKWTLEIIRLLNGEPKEYENYDVLRLYNLARLIVQISIFGNTENLFKYKFAFYIKSYLYGAVDKNLNSEENNERIEHIKDVERQIIVAWLEYFTICIAREDNPQFKNFIQEFIKELIVDQKYNGYLNIQDIMEIFVETAISRHSNVLKELIENSINMYYNTIASKLCDLNMDALVQHAKKCQSEMKEEQERIRIFEY